MTDLIARLEAAGVDEQYDVLSDALRLARKQGWLDSEAFLRGIGWLDYGAYESAAMLLVPEGWWLKLEQFAGQTGSGKEFYHAILWTYEPKAAAERRVFSMNATPALALAAAAVKAKESENA